MYNWIVKYGDPILRKICEPVKEIGEEKRKVFSKMAELMIRNEGIGLAASQIGLSRRLVIASTDSHILKLANPQILEWEGREMLTEACLSIPEVYVKIARAQRIKVQALDENGRKRIIEAEGILSRILQHQIDHLNGILIVDYTPDRKNDKIKGRLRELASYSQMILRLKKNKKNSP
jgi:peptide deformylase